MGLPLLNASVLKILVIREFVVFIYMLIINQICKSKNVYPFNYKISAQLTKNATSFFL